jgi:hypothetical protein
LVREVKPIIPTATAIVLSVVTVCPCRGQIMFSKINPGNLAPPLIEKKQFHLVPMQKKIEYSKPSLPTPRLFENDRIHPHHLYVAPITMPDITFDDLRARKIVQQAIPHKTIAFQNIKPEALERNIIGPARLMPEAVPARPHFDADPRMQGFSKPTMRFDTSIYLHPRNPPDVGKQLNTRDIHGTPAPTDRRQPLGW